MHSMSFLILFRMEDIVLNYFILYEGYILNSHLLNLSTSPPIPLQYLILCSNNILHNIVMF